MSSAPSPSSSKKNLESKRAAVLGDYATERVDHHTRQLAETFPLSPDDQADLRQDMFLELLVAAEQFDHSRGDGDTFVDRVLDRFVRGKTRTGCREIDNPAASPVALDDVAPGFSPVVNGPSLGEFSEQARHELLLDLETILPTMPEPLRELCDLLKTSSLREARARLAMSKESFATAIAEIQDHLAEHGITEAALLGE